VKLMARLAQVLVGESHAVAGDVLKRRWRRRDFRSEERGEGQGRFNVYPGVTSTFEGGCSTARNPST
jgi:hypothetical protein